MLNKNKKNIIIVGAGQLGILISNILIKQKSFNILGFIDNDKKKLNKFINNYKVIGSESYLFKNKKKYINLAIAVGDIIKREKIIKRLKNQNFAFPSIVTISVSQPFCTICIDLHHAGILGLTGSVLINSVIWLISVTLLGIKWSMIYYLSIRVILKKYISFFPESYLFFFCTFCNHHHSIMIFIYKCI